MDKGKTWTKRFNEGTPYQHGGSLTWPPLHLPLNLMGVKRDPSIKGT